jgi:hypothetical protein
MRIIQGGIKKGTCYENTGRWYPEAGALVQKGQEKAEVIGIPKRGVQRGPLESSNETRHS